MNRGADSDGDLLVFISYRREDSAGHAGRLYDDLVRRFSSRQVFVDVDTIPPGAEFPVAIRDAVGRCKALVALIGPRWLTAVGPDGKRRVDDDADYVRLEIQAALERDILVIPVLLQGARMPTTKDLPDALKPLAKRNSMHMLDASWRADSDALAAGLERLAAATGSSSLRGDHEAFWTSAPADIELPYLGLRAFDEGDARFYFGRENDVTELVDRLRNDRFLGVFGPSGSGKSSLVKAGLTQALRAGAVKGSEDWLIESLRPGPHPLETIAARLQRLNGRRSMAELVDAMAGDPRTLHLEAVGALAAHGPGVRMVWVIDQAEELFTLCADEQERAATIANIVHAATVEGGTSLVVLAMRADFYQRCAVYPELAAAISRSQYLVSPMTEAAIRRAIEEPAREVGLSIEPGLVETILEDVSAQPGALPLLEHALFELFQRRRGTTLTLEGYRATGGVQGALARRAELVYDGLDDEEQRLVRRVMLRLTQPGEGTVDTRRRSPLRSLPSEPAEAGPIRHLIDALADARLVTLGAGDDAGEPVVEIAHEALIRAWPRVRTWLEQDREGLRIQRRTADATADWERLGSAQEGLLRGVRLAEAQEWQAHHPDVLNAAERAFLAASTEAANHEATARERQRRRFLVASGSVALFFVLLSGLTFTAWRISEDLRSETQVALAQAEAEKRRADENVVELDRQRRIAIGRGLISEASRPDTPFAIQLLLGLEARRLAGGEANEFLLGRLEAWPGLVRTLPAPELPLETRLARSPDLKTLAYAIESGSDPSAIVLRDMASGTERELGRMSYIDQLRWAPDGGTLLASGSTLGEEEGVVLWRVADSSTTFLETVTLPDSWSVSGDGMRVAVQRFIPSPTGGGATDVVVWDRETGAELLSVPLPEGTNLNSMALSRDGAWLALERAAGEDLDVRIDVWKVDTGQSARLPTLAAQAPPDDVSLAATGVIYPTLAFSSGTDRLAVVRNVGPAEQTVEVWDVRTQPRKVYDFPLKDFTIQTVALASDSMSFAVGGYDPDGEIGVQWATLEKVGEEFSGNATLLPAPIPGLESIRFGADGTMVIGENFEGAAAVWANSKGAAPPPTRSRSLDATFLNSGLLAVGPSGQSVILARYSDSNIPFDPYDPFPVTAVIAEIVDTTTGEHRRLDPPLEHLVVGLSADGRSMAVQTRSGVTVQRLDGIVPAGRTEVTTQFANVTQAVAISKDGAYVAAAAYDDSEGLGPGFITMADGTSGAVLATRSFDATPLAIAFAPDGKTFALATVARSNVHSVEDLVTITLWDTTALVPIRTIGRHPGEITSMAFSSDGNDFSATFSSATVVTWNLESGLVVSAFTTPEISETSPEGGSSNLASSQFRLSADGDFLVTAGASVWIWELSSFQQSLDDRICALAGRNLTAAEWNQYLPGETYAETCASL